MLVAVLCPGNSRLGPGWRRPVVLNAQHSCLTSNSVMSLITIQPTRLSFLLSLSSSLSGFLSLFFFFFKKLLLWIHHTLLPFLLLYYLPNRGLISDSVAPSFGQIAYRLPQSRIQLAAGCSRHRSMTDPERRSFNSTN